MNLPAVKNELLSQGTNSRPARNSFNSRGFRAPAHLAPHLGVTQIVTNTRSVQTSCGKRNKRKEGKKNEMEMEVFHQQNVQLGFPRESLVIDGVAFFVNFGV